MFSGDKHQHWSKGRRNAINNEGKFLTDWLESTNQQDFIL